MSGRRGRRVSFVVALTLLAAASPGVAGAAASFVAGLDREAVAPGQPFIYQITLQTTGDDAADFRPPDFHGFQVQEARGPSKSTSVQFVFGSNQQTVQSSYTWTYQLVLAGSAKGPLKIGAAHVKVGGRELATNPVEVRVGAAGAAPRAQPAGPPGMDPNRLFRRMLQGVQGSPSGDDRPGQMSSTAAPAFIRVVADKTRAFVGEQVTVGWYLFVVDVPSRFGQVAEPHTDGFWSEDIPSTTPPGRLSFNDQQTISGRSYNVALLFKKALFPLAPGKLTITPMEAELTQQADFFAPAEVRRLKTDPLVIEAQPLPAKGAPLHFDASNVGRYEISAAVDRAAVSVGDAVTLKVAVKGTGNVRNVQPPTLPPLPGWKSYEPKTDVVVDGAATIAGTKTVEWLMRPERPGKTTVPSLVLETFDPVARRYETVRSQPIEIAVSGEAGLNAAPFAGAPAGPAGVENVVAGSIRPIHAHGGLSAERGAAFLHSAGFAATVVTPPLALALLALFGRVRERLGRDSRRTRQRRLRTMARRRLRTAEGHRAAGRAGDFYLEIDRVLREALSERLGTELGGLRLDELGALARARGLPDAETAGLLGAIETCDEARFAPGGAAADPATLAAMLARAGELIDAIERAPLGEGARA
ncbi:MAG TPA: BatD family protein [Polyangia bacterium]